MAFPRQDEAVANDFYEDGIVGDVSVPVLPAGYQFGPNGIHATGVRPVLASIGSFPAAARLVGTQARDLMARLARELTPASRPAMDDDDFVGDTLTLDARY